jgi:SP family general alpha glucoside:H+ symporter-like MFS transporter
MMPTSKESDIQSGVDPVSFSGVHPSNHMEYTPNLAQENISLSNTTSTPSFLHAEQITPNSATLSGTDAAVLTANLETALPGLRPLDLPASAATQAEQELTFIRGCRLYPKAIAWSFILSSTLIMEGFDTLLIFNFFAFPAFKQRYGTPTPDSGYQISSLWQFALSTAAEAGEIVGLLANGYLADRIGYRWTMVSALIFLMFSILLAFFAASVQMLLAAQILCGIPWGIFQTLSTTYAAEVMPITLRAYLLSNVNLCWILGQFLATGILRRFVDSTSQWSYRIPFAIQWAIGLPILVTVAFAPESPWWLIRHRRQHDAKRSLTRLTRKDEIHIDQTVAMMEHTNEIEKYLKEDDGGMSYLDAFKGVDRRRTEIACMVWIAQQVCGTSLMGWATTFYEQAGFSVDDAFNLSLGVYGLGIVGAVISWSVLSRFGRRRLYLCGLSVLLITLLVAGIVGSFPTSHDQLWTLGSLLLILTFVYDITIGPICYVLVAEIPSTRLRTKTVVLARIAYNLAGILINWMTPHMLSPTAWDWKGKSCFFFAGTTALCLVWTYWRLPETFGLSYLEIDILFERNAKTSKFRELRMNLESSGYFSMRNFLGETDVWRRY